MPRDLLNKAKAQAQAMTTPTLIEWCTLPAMGRQQTTPEVEAWILSAQARLVSVDVAPFVARVWSYRRAYENFISCDIDGAGRTGISLTFHFGGGNGSRHDFDEMAPLVPDAAEALHMIALLTERVGAVVKLGRPTV